MRTFNRLPAHWLSLTLVSFFLVQPAQALSVGNWFIDPAVGVGFNEAQGTSFRFGLDIGYRLDENLYTGVGAYYAVGNRPDHDREIGGGPFLGYVLPVVPGLFALHLREDINYVDVRIPLQRGNPPEYTDHETVYGVQSATSVGASFSLTSNFGIYAGYRLVIGLTDPDTAKDRSGPALGLSIGI